MAHAKSGNKGFISFILLVIIALVALKYFFNWSVLDAASTERGKESLIYVKDIFIAAWNYLRGLVH